MAETIAVAGSREYRVSSPCPLGREPRLQVTIGQPPAVLSRAGVQQMVAVDEIRFHESVEWRKQFDRRVRARTRAGAIRRSPTRRAGTIRETSATPAARRRRPGFPQRDMRDEIAQSLAPTHLRSGSPRTRGRALRGHERLPSRVTSGDSNWRGTGRSHRLHAVPLRVDPLLPRQPARRPVAHEHDALRMTTARRAPRASASEERPGSRSTARAGAGRRPTVAASRSRS